jgi:hypothetical protein
MIVLLAGVFGPTFGWRIAAKHEEFLKLESASAPREKIREAFRELGWTLDGEAVDGMVAHTKFNWRSWGEIVSLEFREDGVKVRSECAFPSQAIDYGRNRMNVRELIKVLKKKNA